MQFRLTYEGPLLGASNNDNRVNHKDEIRRAFHTQLKKLNGVHPAFSNVRYYTDEQIAKAHFTEANAMRAAVGEFQKRLTKFNQFGRNFFPLATYDWSLMCSLHILFLRPDPPGGVINSGDIDNRIKTLFDALRLPKTKAELGKSADAEAEDPLYC